MEMPIIKIMHTDCRELCPKGQEVGVYYVNKKNTVAQFSFGKAHSTFKSIHSAHKALTDWLAGRKDAADLNVTLLNNHW